jgi:hypothetical protein
MLPRSVFHERNILFFYFRRLLLSLFLSSALMSYKTIPLLKCHVSFQICLLINFYVLILFFSSFRWEERFATRFTHSLSDSKVVREGFLPDAIIRNDCEESFGENESSDENNFRDCNGLTNPFRSSKWNRVLLCPRQLEGSDGFKSLLGVHQD